jgi:hypothetical protein
MLALTGVMGLGMGLPRNGKSSGTSVCGLQTEEIENRGTHLVMQKDYHGLFIVCLVSELGQTRLDLETWKSIFITELMKKQYSRVEKRPHRRY